MSSIQSEESVFVMRDKTVLPMTLYGAFGNILKEKPIKLILGHGLGVKNPQLTGHTTDIWLSLTLEAVRQLDIACILYTARGHGNSTGWQDFAESNQRQFMWSQLQNDMMEVIEQVKGQGDRIFIGGSSMGAATALLTSMNSDKICGLILIRPPTAWETRLARQEVLVKQANKLFVSNPDGVYHHVLLASAMSDLPSLTDDVHMYKRIKCPVLILAHEGDESHPVSTATKLASVIGEHVQLYVASTADEAKVQFPVVISDFIRRVLTTFA